MWEQQQIIIDFIKTHLNMTDFVTELSVTAVFALAVTGAGAILLLLKKAFFWIYSKYKTKQAKKTDPEPDYGGPEPELYFPTLSYRPTPYDGIYTMAEDSTITRSFKEGQILPPHYFSLWPRTVTWLYIPSSARMFDILHAGDQKDTD